MVRRRAHGPGEMALDQGRPPRRVVRQGHARVAARLVWHEPREWGAARWSKCRDHHFGYFGRIADLMKRFSPQGPHNGSAAYWPGASPWGRDIPMTENKVYTPRQLAEVLEVSVQ